MHPSHPDYLPSIFPAVYQKNAGSEQCRLSRVCRRMERTIAARKQLEAKQRLLEEAQREHKALAKDEKMKKAREKEIESEYVEMEKAKRENRSWKKEANRRNGAVVEVSDRGKKCRNRKGKVRA